MHTDSNKTIHTGLLAYGMSGKVFHAPFLTAHPGFSLKAVTERNAKNAQKDYPELMSYNSVEELLNDSEIELVVINTPNNLHYEHAAAALEKGKNILVEKPFCSTTAEAKQLFELAAQKEKKIFFYQNRRWDSDLVSIKEVIDSGVLGKLNEVHFRFDRYRAGIGVKAFKEQPLAASGLQYDLGPHLLDQVISLFGKPLNVYKTLGKNRPQTQVDDFFSIQLSYANSLQVYVTASMMTVDPQPAFVLHGTTGSFIKPRADVQEDQLIAGIRPGNAVYGQEEAGKEGLLTTISPEGDKTTKRIRATPGNYLPLFEAIYQSLTAGKAFPVTEEEVLIQLEILEN